MLSCFNNQLTSLNLSGLSNLQTLWCYNNQLNYLLLKNNNAELFFYGNPNLQYICADEVNFPSVQQKINEYGYTSTCHVNSYCSFTPSGTFYEISGNTKFDLDNNGCNISDINYSYLRFRITNGTNIGSFSSSQYVISKEHVCSDHSLKLKENDGTFFKKPNILVFQSISFSIS